MKCDKGLVSHWLNNQMTEAERKEFELHVSECAACQQEVNEAKKVLNLMKQINTPEPSSNMEVRFQGMIDTYKQSVEERNSSWNGFLNNLYQHFTFRPKFQLTYSIVLLTLGIAIGYLFFNKDSKDNSKEQLAALSSKVEDMRQIMMMSMLENPSASERLKAVSYTEEIINVNTEVIDALFLTLNGDPNVNVRLVTLEALTKYSNNPAVREGLVQSIVQQESPLVQSALADVMLKLQERKSVESFKVLLKKKDIVHPVKNKIEQTINKLSI